MDVVPDERVEAGVDHVDPAIVLRDLAVAHGVVALAVHPHSVYQNDSSHVSLGKLLFIFYWFSQPNTQFTHLRFTDIGRCVS